MTTDDGEKSREDEDLGDEAKYLGDERGVYIPTPEGEDDEFIDFDIDFGTFVLSVATSARVALGKEPHPETKETSKNLAAAKHNIEILQLLKTKTEGNLEPEEKQLLEQVVHDLKMSFVDEV